MNWTWRRWRSESWVRDRERAERWQRGRRRFSRFVAFLGLLLIGGPSAFIGIICSGGGTQPPREMIAPFPMPARDESLTFLDGTRQRLVVAQTDEYAVTWRRGAQRISLFHRGPRLLGRRQHGVRRDDAGVRLQCRPADHAGHPRRRAHRRADPEGRHEGDARPLHRVAALRPTRPRIALPPRPSANWPASSAARRGSSSRSGRGVQQLWAGTPMWGPHVIRNGSAVPCSASRTGVKALARPAARLVAATPPDKDTARLHAWVGGADAGRWLQATGAEMSRPSGPGSFIVTLPRGDAFTAQPRRPDRRRREGPGRRRQRRDCLDRDRATGGRGRGRRGGAASRPRAGQRRAPDRAGRAPADAAAPLARLAEMATWLQRRGAVLEQLYDY